MLVSIQFPDDLVVPNHRKIEEGNLEPWGIWRALSMDAIQMPVDLRSIVEILIAEQVEAVRADAVG